MGAGQELVVGLQVHTTANEASGARGASPGRVYGVSTKPELMRRRWKARIWLRG
jgi:hypothetical protein